MLMKRIVKKDNDGKDCILCFDNSSLGLAFQEIKKQILKEIKDTHRRYKLLQSLSYIAINLTEKNDEE